MRSVPLSRLATTAVDEFVNNVMSQDPEEVFATILDGPTSEAVARKATPLMLVAGVPAFDETSEEPFGLVTIECDVHRLVDNVLRTDIHACRLITLVAADGNILAVHEKARGRRLDSERTAAGDVVSEWSQIQSAVSANEDFIDDNDYQVFATSLHLGHGDNYVTIVV
ncbi:MAG: hypothetical protein ACE5KM_12895, partial [Planctomycetaceae bacterium]